MPLNLKLPNLLCSIYGFQFWITRKFTTFSMQKILLNEFSVSKKPNKQPTLAGDKTGGFF